MHTLTLQDRVELGTYDVITPGEYIVENLSGAQLLTMAGRGTMTAIPLPLPSELGADTLFVRIGGFGDLVLLTPVLREYKRRFPTAKVGVSAMSHYSVVLQGLPFIDEILPYPLPTSIAEKWERWVFFENAIEHNERAKELHMTELFGEIAGLEFIADLKPEYRVRASEAIWCAEAYPRVNGTRRCCIQVGASAMCRVYPRELMGQVVAKMLKDGWEVFLMGQKGEIRLPDEMPKGLRNLADADLKFRQSAAVVSQCDVVIAPDSALLHIAGALGVPAVGLYGPFPWELRTKYCPTTVALSGACKISPCFHHQNPSRKNQFPDNCPTRKENKCGALAEINPERIATKAQQIARKASSAVSIESVETPYQGPITGE